MSERCGATRLPVRAADGLAINTRAIETACISLVDSTRNTAQRSISNTAAEEGRAMHVFFGGGGMGWGRGVGRGWRSAWLPVVSTIGAIKAACAGLCTHHICSTVQLLSPPPPHTHTHKPPATALPTNIPQQLPAVLCVTNLLPATLVLLPSLLHPRSGRDPPPSSHQLPAVLCAAP